MITINAGLDIPFSLQLILGSGDSDEQATVSYEIYNTNGSTVLVSSKSALWNSSLSTYYDFLDVSADWPDQAIGNYLLVWDVSGAESGFPKKQVENLCVVAGEIETGIDLTAALKILLAVNAGRSEGGGTPYLKFKNLDNTGYVVEATCSRKGNREEVTITV